MPYLTGLTLGFSLIMVIGTQNIYIIKQGILRQNSYYCALICGFCDAALIALGVAGAQELTERLPLFNTGLLILGIAFLLVYGGLSIKRAFVGRTSLDNNTNIQIRPETRLKTFLIALGFSLLNPHAFIDSFVILGGVANHLPSGARWQFALGAITASFTWFFVLVTVAVYFSPLLQKKKTWQWMEFISGCVMLYIAVHFIRSI
jgi:L-lysine exporter family protein LysE/ArgO